MNKYLIITFSFGVFVGNFIFHALENNPEKGFAIGLLAAFIVFSTMSILTVFTNE